jgi:hypothetical protein
MEEGQAESNHDTSTAEVDSVAANADASVEDVVKETSETVSLEELFEVPSALYKILGSRKRRLVLEYLLKNPGPTSLDELTRWVTAAEHETLPEAVTIGQRNEVLVRLVHVHLPKLVGYGLVEWDRTTDEVSLVTDNDLIQTNDQN